MHAPKNPSANKVLVLAFALPTLVYGLTLAPGLTWAHHGADGGDLVTAAYTLGVPHPPGYPTYTLLAWLSTYLPLGSVAWRVNLLSALATALAAVFICRAVIRLANDEPGAPAIIAGLGAAWSYAFAPLVWSQALIAEVYALAGLWTALLLTLTVLPPPWEGLKGGTGAAFVLGLLWSLGLGVHLTLLFLAPLVVWFVLRPSSRKAVLLPLTLAFLTGSLVWLYLPLRAGRGGVTWGQPTTLQGLWWLVSGSLYRGYVFSAALGGQLAAWAQTWEGGLGLTGVGLALWGATRLASQKRGWLAACGLSFVAQNLYALGYGTTDSVVYLLPAFVIGSVWLGVGLADLFQRMRAWGGASKGSVLRLDSKGRWLTPVMLAMALVTPAWTLAHNVAALDLSDDHRAEDFYRAVMNESPPGAILLTSTDRQTFSLWYCQQVEGLRPDVVVVDEGLTAFDWYRAGLRQTHPGLWMSRAHDRAPFILTGERPHCRVRREAQAGWLDCQDSKVD